MIEQAKTINSFEGHFYGLNSVLGPVTDAWKEKVKKAQMMFVKVRVVPSMSEKIKELIDTGVRLGGSMGGLYVKDHEEDGVRMLDEVKLLDATLTPMPVNFETLGTASEAAKDCKNGLCSQIYKSIENRYFEQEEPKNKEVDRVNKEMEELTMDEETKKEFLALFKESNENLTESIVKGLAEVLKEDPQNEDPKEDPEENVTKELDKDVLIEEVTAGVLKALGIEVPEEDEDGLEIKDLTKEGLQEYIKEGILEYAKEQREPENQRKSKSQGAGKFEDVGDKTNKSKEESEDEPVKSVKVNGWTVPNPLKTKSITELAKGTGKGPVPSAKSK